jgi:ABC-type molybdate transport system permease subunit
VSLLFGLLMLVATYVIDRRTREDFAFWGYLFGLAAFWGGLSLMNRQSELGRATYCLVNLGLMLLSVLLERRAFIVFGALGVSGYIGHLAYRVFRDSLLFPFALTIIGVGVIFLGIQYQRHRPAIERAIQGCLPEGARRLLPPSRG